MSDFTRLINASDLTEWIMESFPDWCEDDVRLIINHIDDMPSAEPERFVCAEVKMSKEDIQSAVDNAMEKIKTEMEVPEIIRCKDCKNYRSYWGRCAHWERISTESVLVAESDFCSQAERRADD